MPWILDFRRELLESWKICVRYDHVVDIDIMDFIVLESEKNHQYDEPAELVGSDEENQNFNIALEDLRFDPVPQLTEEEMQNQKVTILYENNEFILQLSRMFYIPNFSACKKSFFWRGINLQKKSNPWSVSRENLHYK